MWQKNWTKTQKILLGASAGLLICGMLTGGYFYLKKAKLLSGLENAKSVLNFPGPLFGPQDPGQAKTLSPEKIVQWTNYYREQNSLPDLKINSTLTGVANTKTDDMISKQYFEHISPSGISAADLVQNVGYSYSMVGENLALGGFTSEKDLVDAWMNSPGHRANILNKDYTEIGVSAKLGNWENKKTWWSVQTFAKPAPNCQTPDANLKKQIEQKTQVYNEAKSITNQINQLNTDGNALIDQGNAKIQQGNQIYQSTGDLTQAQSYWDEGKSLQTQGNAKLEQAKSLRNDLNNYSSLYNEIQQLSGQYNGQVDKYNKCIGQ